MAVAVILEFEGATLDQYDAVADKMGLEPGGPGPEGALFHWVAMIDGNLLVTDVWETAEQFQEFSDTQIGPNAAAAGFPGPPKVTMHEVHNYFLPHA